jgi:hypothetical protein
MPSLFETRVAQTGAFIKGGGGSAVGDIFSGFGDYTKMKGDYAEAVNYNIAANFANQEAAFTKQSTAIQEFQAQRNLYQSLGSTEAQVAGAGFAAAGSGLDILRDSASQGALQQAIIERQGLITEAGYKEQAQSYENMANAAVKAAGAANTAATGSFVGAGLKVLSGGVAAFGA